MSTIRVVPMLDTIANNPYHASTTVGDPTTLWGDSDDATYVEFWRNAQDNVSSYGGSATGTTSAQNAVTLSSVTLYARVELFDEGGATATGGVAVDVQRASDGAYLGGFSPTVQPASLGTIIDLNNWDWSDAYAGALADMGAALPGGLQLIISRGTAGEIAPAPWGYGLRVFELNLYLNTGSTSAPQPYLAPRRLHPREDAQGLGGVRLWPPPRTRRNFGGYV